MSPDELRFRTAARDGLAFDNRVVQRINDRLGADGPGDPGRAPPDRDLLVIALARPRRSRYPRPDAAIQGVLTSTFVRLLSDIFVGRVGSVGASELPADLVIRSVRPGVTTAAGNATLHLELDSALAPRQ